MDIVPVLCLLDGFLPPFFSSISHAFPHFSYMFGHPWNSLRTLLYTRTTCFPCHSLVSHTPTATCPHESLPYPLLTFPSSFPLRIFFLFMTYSHAFDIPLYTNGIDVGRLYLCNSPVPCVCITKMYGLYFLS